MVRLIRTSLLAGTLTLAALGTASAQSLILPGWTAGGATGVMTPFGYRPGWFPSQSYQPAVVLDYRVPPRVVYVPVAVPTPRPPVERMETTAVTLRGSAPPADARVKPGTVVTWTNASEHALTLVLEEARPSGSGAQTGRESGVVPAHSSVSLAFNQPGIYRYYLQETPGEQALITVTQ